jgi:hypothetical protein
MGNRIYNEVCVGCGMPLIFPFNEYRTCRTCTEKVKKALYETKMKRVNKDIRKGIIDKKRDPIWTATRPLGEDA